MQAKDYPALGFGHTALDEQHCNCAHCSKEGKDASSAPLDACIVKELPNGEVAHPVARDPDVIHTTELKLS